MSQLVVLGSVNADHVLKVASFPRPGETLQGYDYQIISGGKGANQAVAAARLGARASFIANVGDDEFGQQARCSFMSDGLNVDHVNVKEGLHTGIAMIQVADTGENSIALSAGANEYLNKALIERAQTAIADSQCLLMQLETPLDGVLAAAQIAKRHAVKTVLNPAPAKELPDALLKLVDIITPNETEAQLLTGIAVDSLESAAKASFVLHDKGIQTVIITLGANGVWLSEAGKGSHIEGFKVDVEDTTAAGDTFNAGLVVALLENNTLDYAIRFANASAALSVTKFGAQTSIPYRSDVDVFLSKEKQN
ncbi:ribokinase [Marinomonas epiphytica]